jgi:hypothetical protein
MPTPCIEQSVHIVLGDSAAGSIHLAGARDFIILRDPLCPGPCSVNPTHHRHRRETYLRGYVARLTGRKTRVRAELMRSLSREILSAPQLVSALAAFPSARPVILWTASSWQDRLNLWWVLDAVKRSRLKLGRFWIAEPAPEWHEAEGEMPVTTLGQYSPPSLRGAMATLRPLVVGTLRAGTALWQAFAGRSPRAFDLARRRARPHFRGLSHVTRGYAFLLPQANGRRPARLTLSEFDQRLFDTLRTDAWKRPVDLLRHDTIDLLFCCYGDRWLPRRLAEWSQLSRPHPALLTRAEAQGVNDFTANSYRLTPHGARLRDEGLRDPREAPAMFIGGCRLYGSHPTWVRRSAGLKWWVERLDGVSP